VADDRAPARWSVVLAAVAIQAATYGAQFSFTVFFPSLLPLAAGSRGRLAGVYTLFSLVYCSFSFAVGLIADRHSPRRLMLAGGLVFAAGIALSGAVSSLAGLYLAFGLVAGLGMSAGYVVPTAAVFRSFPRRGGTAVGLASAGIGVGMTLLPPVALAVIERLGWRGAFTAIGAGALVVITAAALALPDAPPGHTGGGAGRPASPLSTAEILAAPQFWLLGLVCATSWLPLYAMWGHLFPMGLARGIEPRLAAAAGSVFGLAGIAGRIGWGYVSDRRGRSLTIGVCLGAQALAFLGLASLGGAGAFFAAVALFGCASGGSVPLLAVLAADLFGAASAARLMGGVIALAGLVATLGSLAAGLLYDRTGSYTPTFALGVALTLIALAVLGRLARLGAHAPRLAPVA
jgi:MFS family permease